MKVRSVLIAAVLGICALPAQAAFHLFRIDQVYSNSDGSVQFVVLREMTGTNNENKWNGLPLVATNRFGVPKQLNFPSDIAAQTASRSVLVATPGFAALGLVTPDFTIPPRFIPIDGGTLDFANGVDIMTLPVLPIDGVMSIDRNGRPMVGSPKNFANATATMTARAVTAIEFYNPSLDHYFISSLAPDIDALDTGRISGWSQTGWGFSVYPSQAAAGAGVTPVCRIIIPPPFGDSHFFGRSVQECADTLTKFPFMSQETPNAFFVALPTAGECPSRTVPVYRVFSNRIDANHRYTIDPLVRDQMVVMGWIAEGDGPDLVAMCAPVAP